MRDPYRPEREREVLPTDVAERLLARAAELDSAQRGSTEIARLREAAAEAGMLPSAFDAALAELRAEGQRRPVEVAGRGRRRAQALLLAALVSMTAIVAVRKVERSRAAPGVEQAFLLRCVAPGDAAALLVRAIPDPASTELKISPNGAPHVLTVRTATRRQMDEVRTQLDRMDGAACAVPGANQAPR